MRILNVVDQRVASCLGRDSPNWRVLNACTACCYKVRNDVTNAVSFLFLMCMSEQLEDEPEMEFSRIWAHDGNNSLKRMLPVGNRVAGDTRTYEDSDYFLSQEYVNRYANEVKSRPATLKRKHREIESEDEADEDEAVQSDRNGEGDPTDGVNSERTGEVDQCVKNWKAAASDDKKRSWAMFDETGIYASACRHHFILWICDMVRSGELYVLW